MTVLLPVLDPHFGTERPPVVEALLQLAEQLNPEVLLLTTDITQRATLAIGWAFTLAGNAVLDPVLQTVF